MKTTPELLAIREEIDTALKSRTEGAAPEAPPAEEIPQTPAGEIPPSMEDGAEEAKLAQAEGETEAEKAIRYVNDLAEAHGLEPEQLYGLMLKLGGDREIPLGEAKDQIAQLDSERQQIEQQRAQLEQQTQAMQARMAQAQQAQTQLTERQERAKVMIAAIEAHGRGKAEEWARRRDIEPGKVALEQQELSAAMGAAQRELQVANAEAEQHQAIAYNQWILAQDQELSKVGSPFHIPEWLVPDKKTALQQEIKNLAMSRYKATPEEILRLDARTILLLKDALYGIRAREEAEKAMSTLKSKHPVIPRSARQSAVAQQRENVAELEKRALATGKTQDKLAAARAILGDRR